MDFIGIPPLGNSDGWLGSSTSTKAGRTSSLRVDYCRMFSPRPPNVQWYYIIEGELDNGTAMELFRDEGMFKWEPNIPIVWDKPDPYYKSFKNHRWFKYYENGINTHPYVK